VTRAHIHLDGSFEIRDVPSGTYQVSVENSRGEVIWHDLVPVAPGVTPLIIELDHGVREQTRTGTVSITRLRQKPTPAAVHELRLGEKASGQRRLRESIEHLQRAVQLAPEMQDARNNLGAKYLQSGDYEAARRELEAAVELDPEASIPHANLALAMLALSRPGEAESEARLALRRDPLSAAANFAAGAALNQQGKSDEALRFLERASEQVPPALLIEARILLARSQTSEAVAKLRSYLSRPGVSQRVEVTGWLDALSARGTR
jgi:tetratricopeptide (TPR) repeat protein